MYINWFGSSKMIIIKNFSSNFILRRLANLQFAIGMLLLIGILIAIGTFIEQDQSIVFYQTNYPESQPIFGFVDWRFIYFLSLNKIYTSYWFAFILFVFASSLIACTFTTQLPLLKKFKLWQFRKNSKQFEQLNSVNIQDASANNLAFKVHKKNYHLFRQNEKTYAYSGLLGRVGPIFVHFSILFLIIGSTWSAFNGYTAQQIIPRGEIFHVQNLLKSGNISYIPQSFSWRVNDFWITYTNEFRTNQFYSDLSLLDNSGFEIKRKTIFVNEPFIYNGITLYQTDWDVLGLKIKINANQTIQVPLKKINTTGRKVWIGSVPITLNNGIKTNYIILINDLFGNLFLYDNEGKLIQESVIGQPIKINSQTSVTFSEFITTTGLQIKTDSGIPLVYFSFFLLMVSVYISFISYSQIWQVEALTNLVVGGKSNRAVLYFQEELKRLVQKPKN
jgi:cytochrome c biogenesis protein